MVKGDVLTAHHRLTPYKLKLKLKAVSEVVTLRSAAMEIYSMAIGIGVPLKIAIRGQWLGEQWQNIMWYQTDGAAFLTADATAVGEAYWDNIKTLWRATMEANPNLTTTSILVSEPGPTGAFGEYPIPALEQQGTRGVSTTQMLPTFNAAGIRLSVATRTTRPGQKRIVGGFEGDQQSGLWVAAYLNLIDAMADIFSTPRTLGAPVATGVLEPIVVSLNAAGDAVTSSQPVIGHVVNPYVTSQVSRKPGRGV